MLSGLTMNDLLDYTDWQRERWFAWMREQKPGVLEISAGPSGDGRFQKAGELVRHIFSGEKRYVDRLLNRSITDTSGIPPDNLEALFELGWESRRDLREYLGMVSDKDWESPVQLQLMNMILVVTPKKIVAHILMHEIRHWAQIATLFRLNGLKVDFHDFLFSPALGGELKREGQTA